MDLEVTLARLTYSHLRSCPAWEVTGRQDDRGEAILAPTTLLDGNTVQSIARAVWCLCTCIFKDGSTHPACAMCCPYSDKGPLAWTVWNGRDDVSLIPPPAPDFVLEKEGPKMFASKFNRNLDSVFPLEILVLPMFQQPPVRRSVRISANGIIGNS